MNSTVYSTKTSAAVCYLELTVTDFDASVLVCRLPLELRGSKGFSF